MSQPQTKDTQKQAIRRLAAIDFDYTIVAQNSDTVVRDMLPQIERPDGEIIDNHGWTEYMAAVFRTLHRNRVSAERILDTVRCLPEVPGFVRLMKRLHTQHNFDLIVISDANSVFIHEWLQAHGLSNCVTAIFTNPAYWQQDGLLCIKPYHQQKDCQISASNLCKGKVLEHFLIEQDLRLNLRYERVVYIGDGQNDICPALRLHAVDIACARNGFAMEKNLIKHQDRFQLQASLIIWQTGFDLLEQLEETMDPKQYKEN